MKRVSVVAVVVVLLLAVGMSASASETNWGLRLVAHDGAGMRHGSPGELGTAEGALEGLDAMDSPSVSLWTDQSQATAWIVPVLSDDLYYRSVKAPASPTGATIWQMRAFALKDAGYGSITISFYTVSSDRLPPESIGGIPMRYRMRMLDNRGVAGAPDNGAIWALPVPTAHGTSPYYEITLPVLKISDLTNASALSEGYALEYRVDPVPEPGSLFSLGGLLGLSGLAMRRRGIRVRRAGILAFCLIAGIASMAALPALARDWPLPPVSYPGKVALYKVGVQNPGGDPVPQAPAFIDYTLNAKADVTIEILPSNAAGVPTGGGAVRTQTLTDVNKGHQLYLWPCVLDDLVTMAPVGYYIARISATSTKTRWDANIGLYINWEIPKDGRWSCPPKDEWGYRGQAYDTAGELMFDTAGQPVMTVYYPADVTPPWGGPVGQGKDETLGGFYGVGVNKNPGSPYLGRIYACHQTIRDILVYDVDGTYLGALDDTGVPWMTSSPWDMVIAEDDYIYVSDRTQAVINCFQPSGGKDGLGVIKSISPGYANDRAIGGGWVDSAGVTHLLISSGQYLYPFTLAADHTTWSSPGAPIISVGGTDQLYGHCYDTSHNTIYTACATGTYMGVRKWTKPTSGTLWNNVGGWRAPRDGAGTVINRSCTDVEVASYDGAGQPATLWITTYSGSTNDIYLVSAATGNQIDQGSVVFYGFMLCQDPVGNVLVGFGKSASSWPSKYFGMFSGAGESTAQVDTGAFYVPADPAPVLVGGSESWTYGDVSGTLIPDGLDTAEVSFQVIDANGFSDIGAIELDIKELRNTDDTTIINPTSVVSNPSSALIADCRANLWARRGVRYGSRAIGLKAYDSGSTTKYTSGQFHVNVAGNQYTATILHTRSGGAVSEALMKFVGGKPGVYGYPFTYYGLPSDVTGNASCLVSEGLFDVRAENVGFKTQALKTVDSPAVVSGAFPIPVPGGLKLGPLTIAEARALTNQAVYASIEGLTYARPKGLAPTACTGQDDRIDSQLTVGPAPTFWLARSWYMCDPTDASAGMEFQLKIPDSAFLLQWDNSTLKLLQAPFTNLWIGKRPDVGDTICVTGWLETRPGYETRVWVDDANAKIVTVANRKIYYYNLTQYGIEPSKALPTPVAMTISDVYHNGQAGYRTSWGKLGRVENAIPVAWRPDGSNPENGSPPTDTAANMPARYLIIADSLNNWTTVTFNSLTSLGIPPTGSVLTPPPCTLGDTYTFTGAVGRHARFSVGTMRVRGTADMVNTLHTPDPGRDTVQVVRGLASGSVSFRGIVTAKFAAPRNCIYVENADRSVGVRVIGNPVWVSVGDDVLVIGDVAVLDGIKRVVPSQPITVLSSGNPMPLLGMRTRDIGGSSYGANDPGVTDGRGALNLGLLAKVLGKVTKIAADWSYFYIWDGSNGREFPLNDGFDPDVNGVRVVGYPPSGAAVGDWTEITGICSANTSAVPGKTIPEIIPKTLSRLSDAHFQTVSEPTGTEIGAEWSLAAVPAVPQDWSPASVFASVPSFELNYRIFRWEQATQSQIPYDDWCPDYFGGIILGDGWWVGAETNWPVTFQGRAADCHQWYTIPTAGWAIMGQPFMHDIEWPNVTVHDGAQVVSMETAAKTNDWLNSIGYWWDNATQSQGCVGIPDDYKETTTLKTWHGYWIYTNRSELSLILPY